MTQNDITLHPALPTDAITLAKLHSDAFADDKFLELLYGPLVEEIVPFAEDLEQIIREDPNTRVVKAVDESGLIVGWSWWIVYRDAKVHKKAELEAAEKGVTPPPTSVCPQAYLDWRRLIKGKRDKWIAGKAVAILQVLAVHPWYQGRGIGTMLVKAGVDEAKSLRIPAWLEASSAGYSIYLKCGFRDVDDTAVVDLTKYGLSGTTEGYCMLRDVLDTD
ncbi:putative GNAT family acetyltransferase [Aspergillus avenaceus]|uniref:Putative GNAT family acetyltransferase n=1 Tax=Aspergillus avenaceus TaxID=36643 RepID=A0A5N6TVY8_ASPAV|nr:putative GNAT family acetyltransferase [Aspergillus avenaceus]